MRHIRLSLIVLAACLAATALTAKVATRATAAEPASFAVSDANYDTGHLHDAELPWKANPHRLGLRRSSEPIKSLLVTPALAIFRLSAPAALVPVLQSTAPQKVLLHQQSPRGPPLAS